MAKKATKAEVEHRVQTVARLLINCVPRSQIIRHAQESWGVKEDMTDRYISRARELVRQDYEVERKDFIATRLGTLDKTIQEALKSNQLGVVVGALRLQADLTGIGK